jgi:hypothetical protein
VRKSVVLSANMKAIRVFRTSGMSSIKTKQDRTKNESYEASKLSKTKSWKFQQLRKLLVDWNIESTLELENIDKLRFTIAMKEIRVVLDQNEVDCMSKDIRRIQFICSSLYVQFICMFM